MHKNRIPLLLACLLALAAPAIVLAQTSALTPVLNSHVFSYSLIEVAQTDTASLESLRAEIVTDAIRESATEFATWTLAAKPADAPFAGLMQNQIVVMLAWPSTSAEQINSFNEALQSRSELRVLSSRLFDAIYLPEGLRVPTGEGFYVHREEKYSQDHVSDAVRLSKEAWVTWEPHWGVKVIGLFRELGETTELDNLNRIVWYPSHAAWLETRNFTEDPESAARFRERRTLLIPGSGIAIATNRSQP